MILKAIRNTGGFSCLNKNSKGKHKEDLPVAAGTNHLKSFTFEFLLSFYDLIKTNDDGLIQ